MTSTFAFSARTHAILLIVSGSFVLKTSSSCGPVVPMRALPRPITHCVPLVFHVYQVHYPSHDVARSYLIDTDSSRDLLFVEIVVKDRFKGFKIGSRRGTKEMRRICATVQKRWHNHENATVITCLLRGVHGLVLCKRGLKLQSAGSRLFIVKTFHSWIVLRFPFENCSINRPANYATAELSC